MDSQLNSVQLEISRGVIKADAIHFATFGSLFLLFSLMPWNFDVFIWSALLYAPFLLVAYFGYNCSKTHHKSYLECYNIILIIHTVYLLLLAVIAVLLFIVMMVEIFYYECDYEDDDTDCSLGKGIGLLVAILLMILGLLLISSIMLAIVAIGHSDKVAKLLSNNMKRYQQPLMQVQGNMQAINPYYPQQEYLR